jgi:ribosomal protein L31
MELLKNYTIRFRSSTGASTDFTVLKTFNISSASRADDEVTLNVSSLSHPIQVGDILTVASSNTSLNTSEAVVTAIGAGFFKYVLAGSNLASTPVTGTAKLNSGYYDTIGLTTTSIADEVNSGDLFLFGEYQQEAQDLIITNIEPTSNKSARITMVDYGVTDTYNIFQDYTTLTEATVFETQITKAAKGLLNSFKTDDKPTITYIQSDDLVADIISPGTYAYKIKVSYSNPSTLPNTVASVECQYAYSATTNSSGYKSIIVDYLSNTIEIPNVIAGEEYKVRLRYLSSDGRVGLWSTWINHTVSGRLVNYNTVTSVTVKRSRKNLVITPFTSTMPNDFKYFETKVFKDSGSGDFWADTNAAIKTYTSTGIVTVSLTDFASPRISHNGTKYRIACRMLDNAGNYSTQSALTSIILYDISP